MPSPKDGSAGSAVSPTDPSEAQEADKADPGEVEEIKAEQRKAEKGKYGSVKTKPHQPPASKEEKAAKKSWIEIDLVDENGKAVPGERYCITLPEGETVAEGTLNEKGFARIEGFEAGTCKVTFPNLDRRDWKPS